MSTVDTSDIKKGLCIVFHDAPHVVVEKTFVSPGKGSAFYRTKLKNLKNGSVVEFTFKSGEKLQEADVEIQELQYLYPDGENLNFMNPRTYEQFTLPKDMAGGFFSLMKEGENYQVYLLDNQAIAIRPPLKVFLKVAHAEAGAKGNTVTGATKEVELETGHKVLVPIFIKEGDIVSVNVDSGDYVERVQE